MSIKKALVWVALMALLFVAEVSRADLCAEPVETESGRVRGVSEAGTCAWRGIPFAAPPVGELRWASPKPHRAWSGVRESAGYGARCMQKGIMEALNADPSDNMSEDCLYLNVWRPEQSGVFPVMIWIHGGGYSTGTGNSELYRGDRLARDGEVVVVTINYRLNVFGYFAHPALREKDPDQSTGNYGSLDQVAAIEWVRENIKGFGGDPDNITIFGESAGGRAVCTMLATPLARGMFHRAIVESGGCETSAGLEKGYEQARSLVKNFDCDFADLECLRGLPADKLLDQGSPGMVEGGLALIPHHDGHLLSDTPLAMIRSGNYNRVPFLAGYNKDEFGVAVILMPDVFFAGPAKYEKLLAERLGLPEGEAKRLAALYPLDKYGNKPRNAYHQIIVDGFHACPTTLGLTTAAAHNPDAYLYRFDYDGMRGGKYIGAMHSMEIPFIFDAMDRAPVNLLYHKKNMEEAKALSRTIQGYWVNFARTGDPNGPGLPAWPKLDPDSKKLQVLDVNTRTEEANTFERCSFWKDYSRYMSSPLTSLNLEE